MTRSDSPAPLSTLTLAGRQFALHVVRHRQARRTTLRIEPWTDAVRLTLPPRAPLKDALIWARDQRAALERAADARPRARPFVPGGSVPVDGVDRPILHRPDGRGVRIGEVVEVGGPADRLAPRLIRALRERARVVLTAETAALADRHGLRVASVGVGDPSGRWGSCSADGRVRYSWRLILMPPPVRAMIVAHELAHLTHMNHSPAFHVEHRRLLGEPPASAGRWLRANGRALHGVGRG